MLWISWPKSKQLDSDLSMPKVIQIGYDRGLVESKCVSIDSTRNRPLRPHAELTRLALDHTLPPAAAVEYTSVSGGGRDLGFIAEEVATIHPLVAT